MVPLHLFISVSTVLPAGSPAALCVALGTAHQPQPLFQGHKLVSGARAVQTLLAELGMQGVREARGRTRRGNPGDAACTSRALLPDQTPSTGVPQQAGLGAGEQSPIRVQETIHAGHTPHQRTLEISRDPHTLDSHPAQPGAVEDTIVKIRPCPKVSPAGSLVQEQLRAGGCRGPPARVGDHQGLQCPRGS